jgi:hypothetical protein
MIVLEFFQAMKLRFPHAQDAGTLVPAMTA